MCEIGTRASPSFPEELDANNYVFRLISSNDSSYNLCSFAWELVYLGKSLLSKIACVEWKMISPCIWCIKN